MDEIQVVKLFRDQLPERDEAAREVARSRLAAELLRPAPARARPFWQSRRGWVLVAAALAAVAVVSSAFGWTTRLIDAIAGAPAPTEVKHAFAVGNDARARQVMPLLRQSADRDTIVERTHGVIGINSSVGPVIIWAAPTKGGGICWLVDIERQRLADGRPNGGGGCARDPRPQRAAIEYGLSAGRVGDASLMLLDGRVREDVGSVELRYADGDSEQLPVIEGFFLAEPRTDSEPTLLIARDHNGDEIQRQQIRSHAPIQPSSLGPEHVLIRLQTSDEHTLTFGVARNTNRNFCEVTTYRGAETQSCGIDDPRNRVAADELSISPTLWNEAADRKPLLTLDGVVGSEITRLELQYSDGAVVPMPITERFVVFEVPPERQQDSHFTLIGYSKAGEVIARRVVK